MLQIAFKAINDMAGPDSLVLALLFYGIYPHIVTDFLPSAFQ